MKKLFKSFLCITLASLMLLSLIPSAFAASISKDYADNYMPGTVLVGVKKDAPRLQEIIPQFEVERTEYADMDPVYISYVNSPKSDVTYVKLVLAEQTKEIVWEAIDALKKSEYITVAEPFYCVYQKYAPGRVIVSLDNGTSISSVTAGLDGLNVTDTKLLTPGSDLRIYLIYLEEQTKEIVWEAMQILNGKKGVKCAEPDFYGEFTVVPVYKNGDADEDGELSVIDATMVQRYLVDSTVAVNMVNSDMNYDGKVTILDATAIQRSLANL
ncbi:MAG: dockerin type I repeat-containing protein [Ruminococcus sp.]|nr:dockerin type I repeat-containing protein [Ruminococcus sp.]